MKHKYGNTDQDSVWIELDKAAKEDSTLLNLNFADVMNTWTLQMGHPLITLERINNKVIKITQTHFLADSTAKPIQPSPYK